MTYSAGDDETTTEAVLSAFLAAQVDIGEKPTVLYDHVSPELLEGVSDAVDPPVYLATHVWEHWLVATPDEIRIYEPETVR